MLLTGLVRPIMRIMAARLASISTGGKPNFWIVSFMSTAIIRKGWLIEADKIKEPRPEFYVFPNLGPYFCYYDLDNNEEPRKVNAPIIYYLIALTFP